MKSKIAIDPIENLLTAIEIVHGTERVIFWRTFLFELKVKLTEAQENCYGPGFRRFKKKHLKN